MARRRLVLAQRGDRLGIHMARGGQEILAPQVLPSEPIRARHHRLLEPLGQRLGGLEHGAGPSRWPNWFKNWCIAPVIVDPEQDEVYFTPLYDVMCHFSKFIRPGATVLASDCEDAEVMAVATENADGTYVVVCFNPSETARTCTSTVFLKTFASSSKPNRFKRWF